MARYVVSNYVSNSARCGGQMWYRVVDTVIGKTVAKGFKDVKSAIVHAERLNAKEGAK